MTPPAPDISVVLVLHDTAPRPAASLTSLVAQTIGRHRMEVVVVDAGAVGGGGAEAARIAAGHPELFRTVRHTGPGGPAAAADLGTGLARGRYLLPLGAGDRLGPEALERLVAAADRWHSDVVVPRQTDQHGRPVPARLFDRSRESVTFTDSALAWSLADTKLLRRELIERHGLRRRAGLPPGAEQPFALAALLHARTVSVLADQDLYHLAPDADPLPGPMDRLRAVRALQEQLDALAPPGPVRDAVRARHFSDDLPGLLRAGYLAESTATQRRIAEEIGRLLDRHCPSALFARLAVSDRVRLALARRGELAALRTLVRYEAAHPAPPVVRRGGRLYAAYPAFRDRRLGLPDALFELPARRPAPTPTWRRAARLVPPQVRRGLRGRAARLRRAANGGPGTGTR
ncbi:glycosyltransferase [Kitasatospora paracochleata]|uniref:Glycosyl transferase family 2 n=2 Tax=Kitasatospora paracochleata TaxID=58354 RepID=A0ABT1IYC7_9ACTN|nr:glycosyltransferase [Kitasatospora paracochleata]MCP2310161.1 hypothetical protein [Kitasatospora paracochleata]